MTALPTTPTTTNFPTSPVVGSPLTDDLSTNTADSNFIDRRSGTGRVGATERRQFTNSHFRLSPEARALAEAIDQYKIANHRRYITFEEMLQVITQLGYRKQA